MDNQPANVKQLVLFVPGGVMPAELSFGPLLSIIGDQIRPVVKDLEVYATDAPPTDYRVELEVEGIRRAAEAAGAERFHLVGYSGGGAFSVAFTAKYPEQLINLALIEPAWIGSPTADDAEDWAALSRVMTLPPEERMQAFMAWHMRPGLQPPAMRLPPGPPPAWMAKRPAGQAAMSRAFDTYRLDQVRFRQFRGPVYYALGSLTNRFFEREAKTLASLVSDFRLEEYEGRSHFDPPHRAEPERFARAVQALWARATAATTTTRPAQGLRKQSAMTKTISDWRNSGIRVVRQNQLDFTGPSWPALQLGAAITHVSAGANKIWAGAVTFPPNARTGPHHHGALESVIYVVSGRARMRWGEQLEYIAEAGPGDFIYVPPRVPHQEMNASADEVLVCVLVRNDQEPTVVRLAIAGVEAPEAVAWVDPHHPRV